MSANGRYKMQTFCRLTGFSPSVLRAWERRHGLLCPERVGGRHRYYTDADLRVIRRVRELLGNGQAIGEIARLGRHALLSDATSATRSRAVARPGERVVGNASPVPLARMRAEVVRAALELDGSLLGRVLDEAFSALAPLTVVDQVMVPAAREIGGLWAEGRLSLAGEHLVTSQLAFRVRQLLERAGADARPRAPLLCACLPDETHELGLLTVCLHLAMAGAPVTYLGARVPVADLEHACRVLGPSAVCLSVTRPELLDRHAPELSAFARRWTPGVPLMIGGAGIVGRQPELEAAGVRLWRPGNELSLLVAELAATSAERPGARASGS